MMRSRLVLQLIAMILSSARGLQQQSLLCARRSLTAIKNNIVAVENENIMMKAAETSRRPSKDDVERISFGKPSKQKGVGSRGTPHRLNLDERKSFESAKRKGFVELMGSGWRKERRDAPLYNTWRNWCDAVAAPSIFLLKGLPDAVVLDLSPLRTLHQFGTIAQCLHERYPNSDILFSLDEHPEYHEEDWLQRPLHQLPRYEILWNFDNLTSSRADAKSLAKVLALDICNFPILKTRSSSIPKTPRVKPGKSRRSGGYGIG